MPESIQRRNVSTRSAGQGRSQGIEPRMGIGSNIVPLPEIEVRHAQHRCPVRLPKQRLQIAFETRSATHLRLRSVGRHHAAA
jgi:hypothetical protein